MELSLHQQKFFRAAQALAAFAAFAVVFPVGLGNVTMALMLAALLLGGKLANVWLLVKTDCAVQAALCLFVAFAAGMSYSSADFATSFQVLNKYRSLLLFPVLLFLFQQGDWRKRAYAGYLIAVAVAICASWGMRLGLLPPGAEGSEWTPFKGRIDHGFFVAFAIYLMVTQLRHSRDWRQLSGWGIAILIAAHNLLFMCSGRTGVVVLVGLISLFAYQQRKFWVRYWLPVMTVGVLVLAILVINSAAFSGRKLDMVDAQTNPEGTSMGQRITFWKTSLRIIADHPLIGAGTGSFEIEYIKHADPQSSIVSKNPHNEFFFVASQLGMLGLTLLVGLFWQVWHAARRLSPEGRVLAQGVVVAMVISCLLNSSLRDSGYFFAIFAGLALASPKGISD